MTDSPSDNHGVILTALGWFCLVAGMTGSWVAGKRRVGWLICATSAFGWMVYDLLLHLWPAVVAGVVGTGIAVRNYFTKP